jgi:hypothetical protein
VTHPAPPTTAQTPAGDPLDAPTTTVTVTVRTPDGTQEITETAAADKWVLPLLFRAVHAVVATRPGEVAAITTAVKLIADFASMCAPRPDTGTTEDEQ